MKYTATIILTLLLAVNIPYLVSASELKFSEPVSFELPDLYDLYELDRFNWQHANSQMSLYDYEKASRYNKHLLRRAIKDYLETKFTSLGMSQSTFALTGAAVLFATGQDAKFSLNESKTMSIELKDLREEDRAILYRLNYSW